MNYYNEFDPKAAAWLRELIKEGLISDGEVDTRDIREVVAADLRGFAQCHFFAGIGGWSVALRLTGWPDDRPVWTGSCPCQPFSQAGKGAGENDPRHLWPEFRRLIAECRPSVVFGEQVASKAGRNWIAAVRTDMEALAYAVGIADLCAAGVRAPHIRQRLYFVAESESLQLHGSGAEGRGLGQLADGRGVGDSDHSGSQGRSLSRDGTSECVAGAPGVVGGLADARRERSAGQSVQLHGRGSQQTVSEAAGSGATGSVADAGCGSAQHDGFGLGGETAANQGTRHQRQRLRSDPRDGRESFWSACDWIPCRDGKYRPVEPGTFPLAHGIPARVGRLRGYGNAIVPQVAAEFIRAYEESR